MSSRFLRFWLIVAVLLAYTGYKVIQLFPLYPLPAALASILIFVLMLSGTFIYRANHAVFDAAWFRILAWMGSLAMACWATFILISIPFDILDVIVSGFHIAKRTEIFRSLDVLILSLSGGFVGLGFLQVLRGPTIRQILLRVKNLPAALQGFRIAQISDLHVGPTLRKGYVDDVVKRVNSTDPDLIVFTGDMADAQVSSIDEHLQPLRKLKSSCGSFYVTGNHEYYWDAPALIEKITELGFKPLLNENKTFKIGDSKLMIAGVTDPAGEHLLEGHKPDAAKAAASTENAPFKILLAHRPDACVEAEKLGFDLQLSGHTHAGQFFPFSLLIGLFHKYSRGLYRHGRMWVYVNPGTGYWGPADRLGVASEISLITLASEN